MTMGSLCSVLSIVFAIVCVAVGAPGPYSVKTGTYRLPASQDNLILDDRLTEIWAEVYYPKNIITSVAKFPLVVFLHGNHATCGYFLSDGTRNDVDCSYTDSGTCPSRYVVAPNHEGYRYVGKPLASYGYIVVSINANRGITCGSGVSGDWGLNLARGRLVLRHLALWSAWSKTGGAPSSLGFNPLGKVNFLQVGLMGHSRGGEGMRAALAQYRDAGSPWKALIGNMNIRAVFEVGPVDGQTSRTLNAYSVASVILLPSCDGDVSDLQGMHVFDRQFLKIGSRPYFPKGTILVNGAMHNFYNTEWQQPDSFSCTGTPLLPSSLGKSVAQQKTLTGTLIPFMRAYVGPGNGGLGTLFDPSYSIPASLASVSFYARNHLRDPLQTSGTIQLVESFSQATGQSDGGRTNKKSNVVVTHTSAHYEHDPSVRVAQLSWTGSGTGKYFEVALGTPTIPFLDFTNYRTLSFRLAVYCTGQVCASNIDNSPDMDLHIRLAQGSILSTAVQLSSVATVRRPVDDHSILETIDLAVELFQGVDLSLISGVRFVFDVTPNGQVDIAHITRDVEGPQALPVPLTIPRPVRLEQRTRNDISGISTSIRVKNMIPEESNTFAGTFQGSDGVELMFNSTVRFPVTDSFPMLTVGSKSFTTARLAVDTYSISFVLTHDEIMSLDDKDTPSIQIGSENVWMFAPMHP